MEICIFQKVANDLNQFARDDVDVKELLLGFQDSKNIHEIGMPPKDYKNSTFPNDPDKRDNGQPTGSTVRYDPDERKTEEGEDRTPRVGLAHELSHSWDHNRGETTPGTLFRGEVELYEVDAIKMENKIRAVTGDKRRTSYMGYEIPEEYLKD